MSDTSTAAEPLTRFAPPERADADELDRAASAVASQTLLREMLDAVPVMVAVLNTNRQIVAANQAMVDRVTPAIGQQLRGLRPGEALQCVHATREPGGCGTSRFCRNCGAVTAILGGLAGKQSVEECRIVANGVAEAFDFRVWSRPVEIAGEQLCVFAIADIADEKRRHALERVFFHDVLNTAGSVMGCLEVARFVSPERSEEMVSRASALANRLVEEIKAQRELLEAEQGDVRAESESFDVAELVGELVDAYRTHPVSSQRKLAVKESSAITMRTDRTLLSRVLGNMLKNALEAALPGDAVTIHWLLRDRLLEIYVHNPNFIDERVQEQIFQRSFSTKGAGRGLGTYGMRLLCERYLGGSVDFVSDDVAGTTFRARVPMAGPRADA